MTPNVRLERPALSDIAKKRRYSPTDNGKQMIGADLGFGDLLVLVLELDDEMTALGFPNA